MNRLAMLALCALLPMGAQAQLYKCKGADGKVVYSDTRCEGSEKGSLRVTPNSSTQSEREKAMEEKAAAEAEAAKRATAEGRPSATPGASSAPGARYALTNADRERIRELELTMSSQGATREQKEGASFEISSIRSGSDARLDADQRSRRDSLRTDLSSVDAKKRRQALDDFRRVYY